MPTPRSKYCAVAKLLSVVGVALFLAGCQDINVDYQNCTGVFGNHLVVKVTFDGATPTDSSKLIEKWASSVGPPTSAKRDSANHWTFRWDFTDPINVDGIVHVGATLKSGVAKIKEATHEYHFNPPPNDAPRLDRNGVVARSGSRTGSTGPVPDLISSLEVDPSRGYALFLSNGSSASLGAITLTRLRWVRVLSHVPLDNLRSGDPVIEGLAWQDAPVTLPLTILPGASPTVVDVPDGSIHSGYLLTRYETTAGGGCLSQGFTEQPGLLPSVQGPALGAAGATALLVLLLALGGVWSTRIARRERIVQSGKRAG